MKIGLVIIFVFLSSMSHAFDEKNSGVYAAVHRDGHVTDKIFRLINVGGGWALEDKKSDGTWDDVTCEDECKLVVSSPKYIEIFMGGKPPEGVSAECIHNQAFAFCSVINEGESERNYILLANANGQVIPIKLKRLSGL